ncbi:XrtA-associated tyrosine autokinase [Massilia sp. PWRC2]|uniref:XrtA-associated tyrosine autokinase n=1 Tax=Massilia sp. PWRC2 TaxID=2804626 RepID=UPI003CECF294
MSIIEKAARRIDQKKEAQAASTATLQAADTDVVIDADSVAAPPSAASPQATVIAATPVALPVAAPAVAATVAATVAPAVAPVRPASLPELSVEPVVLAEAAPVKPRKASTRKVELDLNRMRDMGMVTAAGGRTLLVEDFRIIKRPLIKRAFAEPDVGQPPNNLIMITSSVPGEGKTYCAINLAMSIAMELDHTVLLIDADVARPSVLRTLGLPAQRGLMDILLDDKLELSDVMLRTNVDTLSLLPAGTSTPRATELLASQTMKAFVYEIANRYPDRIVIFDSPPLLLTSEAHVLASHMGQIVLVVESETTTQHAVKESLRQLEGCSNVNLIYNKTREFPGIEETYDYHYG